jgi:hypothetical protein
VKLVETKGLFFIEKCACWAIVILLVTLIVFLQAWIFMLAYNFAIVPLFHAPQISLWQSVAGLFVVCIIGSFFKKP